MGTRPECLEDIHEGMIAARFTLEGAADKDMFSIRAIVSRLDGTPAVEFGPDHYGVNITSAAAASADIRYAGELYPGETNKNVRNSIRFAYGGDAPMSLANLVSGQMAGFDDEVDRLTDNTEFANAGHRWEVSALGMEAVRSLHRVLYVASSRLELNSEIEDRRELTHPEIRADKLLLVGVTAFNAYMCMPPEAT